MPVEYHIDKKANALFSRAWGTLSDSDLIEHQRLITNDPDFKPDLHQLFDFTKVTRVALTAEGIALLASRDPFGMGAKRAFIVSPGAMVMFGMMRMLETLCTEHLDEFRVQFDHISKARLWLGLTET